MTEIHDNTRSVDLAHVRIIYKYTYFSTIIINFKVLIPKKSWLVVVDKALDS